ncbi:adenosine deaminase [Pseudactinotalea sp.]|uniref:adenosine deaminase n=1 Tax=Pseudactinotalea sp. TaxID=1926260 RepID=UPI003B3B95CA
MVRDLRTLPKAHLHLHFTGSLAPETLIDLAREQGRRLPESLIDAVVDRDPVRLPANERGWFRFQRMYDAARAVVTSESVMRRLVDEAVAADAAEGSVRLELQVDPTSYAPFVGGLPPALEIVLDAARGAARRHGIEVGIIVAASRMRHPMDARTLARLAARHAGPDGVVGFGLSNDERRGSTAEFGPAFAIARRAGLASVPHGGELLGPGHVSEVLDSLAPDRLGHGVRTAEDTEVLSRVVDAGVALEVCPTSNVSLGVYPTVADVPLRQLVDAGARVALAADDPLIFGPRLLEQYQLARDVHGFTDSELAALASASIEASTASETSKKTMRSAVERWLEQPDVG